MNHFSGDFFTVSLQSDQVSSFGKFTQINLNHSEFSVEQLRSYLLSHGVQDADVDSLVSRKFKYCIPSSFSHFNVHVIIAAYVPVVETQSEEFIAVSGVGSGTD